MINLSTCRLTFSERALTGGYDVRDEDREALNALVYPKDYSREDNLPTSQEISDRARLLAELAEQQISSREDSSRPAALLSRLPDFLLAPLEKELEIRGIRPCYLHFSGVIERPMGEVRRHTGGGFSG